MAGVGAIITSGAVQLSASTAKTVLMAKAASNHRAVLKEAGISFQGVAATDPPILVELVRCSTDGTGTAVTPAKKDPSHNETLQTTAAKNFTVEPTVTDIVRQWYIHAQSGVVYPLDVEGIPIPGDQGANLHRLALRCTPGSAPATVNSVSYMDYDE